MSSTRVELLEDPLYLALPRDHELATKRKLRLEDLRGEAWVQTSSASPCARHVVRSCHAAGFEPNVVVRERRLPDRPGPRRGRRRRRADPRAGADPVVREDIAIRALSPRPPVRQVIAATPAGARLLPAAPAMLASSQRRPRGTRRLPRPARPEHHRTDRSVRRVGQIRLVDEPAEHFVAERRGVDVAVVGAAAGVVPGCTFRCTCRSTAAPAPASCPG